ncbi:hypothetical protein, partial [Burkholderia ubonensis]|uniref:hypothetical protein n=1 Tax=Burkholderia ubonensis TaxID=101571 RepID=UPI001E6584E4
LASKPLCRRQPDLIRAPKRIVQGRLMNKKSAICVARRRFCILKQSPRKITYWRGSSIPV